MIVVIDDRATVKDGYEALFGRLGVSTASLCAADCLGWLNAAGKSEMTAAEAFLIGECAQRVPLSRHIRGYTAAPMIAMTSQKSLPETLALLQAGCDDVLRQPVHVREILARIEVIRRRAASTIPAQRGGIVQVFADGRDAIIDGRPLPLPRRERRILEHLVANQGCWVSKAQLFNSVYGVFRDDVSETVVECHVSRLRKRLRDVLGSDPIAAQRHSGYRFDIGS